MSSPASVMSVFIRRYYCVRQEKLVELLGFLTFCADYQFSLVNQVARRVEPEVNGSVDIVCMLQIQGIAVSALYVHSHHSFVSENAGIVAFQFFKDFEPQVMV